MTILAGIVLGSLAVADPATGILKDTGVAGGLVVRIGCDDAGLVAALRANDGYLVQGLDTSAENVAKARERLSDKGPYGKVTARTFDGKNLSYRDNMVNLIVVSDARFRVPNDEIMRVLAPHGVAYTDGKKQVKPRPRELDEWTHYHHDPQGTMVAQDRQEETTQDSSSVAEEVVEQSRCRRLPVLQGSRSSPHLEART